MWAPKFLPKKPISKKFVPAARAAENLWKHSLSTSLSDMAYTTLDNDVYALFPVKRIGAPTRERLSFLLTRRKKTATWRSCLDFA